MSSTVRRTRPRNSPTDRVGRQGKRRRGGSLFDAVRASRLTHGRACDWPDDGREDPRPAGGSSTGQARDQL